MRNTAGPMTLGSKNGDRDRLTSKKSRFGAPLGLSKSKPSTLSQKPQSTQNAMGPKRHASTGRSSIVLAQNQSEGMKFNFGFQSSKQIKS